MEISGNVIAILPSQSGEGAKGPWLKMGFVIETKEQYPKKIMFSIFSKDATSRLAFGVDDNVTVSFSVESREYNGKWYSDIKAYKVTTEGQRAKQDKPSTPKQGAAANDDLWDTPTKQEKPTVVDNSDDLPF